MKEHPIDQDKIRRSWKERGFSCEIWTDPPGKVWRDYVHEVDELLMLIDGEIELSFQGKTLRPKVGEEILIPAHASHTVKNIGAAQNRWFYGYKQE